MDKPSSSPQRGTFQRDGYIKRALEDGKSLDEPEVAAMIEWYDSWGIVDNGRAIDPSWQEYNLEWDLRTTDWILEKVRTNDQYAQNLYAALCNNDFAKDTDTFRILKKKYWHCSWRYAGGIIADMRQVGDYIDWYCSGIRHDYDDNLKDGYVFESVVTDEIRQDLERLEWIVIYNKDYQQ